MLPPELCPLCELVLAAGCIQLGFQLQELTLQLALLLNGIRVGSREAIVKGP